MRKNRVGIAALALAALLAGPVEAQQPSPLAPPATVTYGQFYAGIAAGGIIPSNLAFHGAGMVGGVASTFSGNLEFDPGASVGGFLGYNLNDNLAIEGEYIHSDFDISHITGTSTGFFKGSATLGVNGDVTAQTFMGNVIVRPLGRGSFTPYLGAGLGFTELDTTITTISGPGGTATVNGSGSERDLTADAIAGFDWAVNNHWALGARYRFIFIDTSAIGSGGGITSTSGNFTGHLITANATYHF